MVAPVTLPAGWGLASVYGPEQNQPRHETTARAYDHLGNQLVWRPPVTRDLKRIACDLEHRNRDVTELAARYGIVTAEFRRRWVAAEVFAKLYNIPILDWLRQHGLPGRPTAAQGAALLVLDAPTAPQVMAFGFLSSACDGVE